MIGIEVIRLINQSLIVIQRLYPGGETEINAMANDSMAVAEKAGELLSKLAPVR